MPSVSQRNFVGPESNLAVAQTRSGRIGVLAAPATVASGACERAVLAADPLVKLTSVACPQLARISQDGAPITEDDVTLARTYCAPLRAGEGRYSFLCTGDAAAFAEVGSRFLQLPMGTVDQIALPTEVPA